MQNGFNYTFGYDAYGNNTTVSAPGRTLVTTTYDPKTGLLSGTQYGKGQSAVYGYDSQGRLISTTSGANNFRYYYDNSGNIGYMEDSANGVKYRYAYDSADRLESVNDDKGNSTVFGYDNINNMTRISEILSGKSSPFVTDYTYDRDSKLTAAKYNNTNVQYNYDSNLGRLDSINLLIGGINKFTTSLVYETNKDGYATSLLKSIDNKGNSISYTYDKNRNIETIVSGGKTIRYAYDALNELAREDNEVLGNTITYEYDVGGNITKNNECGLTSGDLTGIDPKNTTDYAYDKDWKDLLTSYDGKPVTYDAIGNTKTYDGWTYTWQAGRQLAAMTSAGQNVSFKYNDAGIRTEKTVFGKTTKYHLVGDQVTYETNDTDKIYYRYAPDGSLISMNLNGTEYYYIKNGQGDIIGLYDGSTP